jgi:hypothetical protein
MKGFKRLSVFLHLFIGMGAVGGGLGGVIDPYSPMGMPIEVLRYSPFRSFFLPGLFLLIVIGLGNILSFVISRMFEEARGYLSCFLGAILCIWLIVQCIFLRDVVSLHIIFFILGILQGLFFSRQFPYYDIVYFFARRKDKRKFSK